jgi:glutamate dehydrogenase/leucine dehydrogenase
MPEMTATTGGVFARMAAGGYETLVYAQDAAAGLRALIAIHDTTRGPALGGVRMRDYACEDDAVDDVLRLAEAMTYKAALAGLRLGGGKAVVLAEPPPRDRVAAFRGLGRIIERLGGSYIATEDMGTTTADLAEIRRETRHGVGLPESEGGGGDPSPTTAFGVLQGMRAVLTALGERDSLTGRRVAVQGVGKVGLALVGLLAEAGAMVIVADTDERRVAAAVRRYGATAVAAETILFQPVEILSPCAAGGVLGHATLPGLRCRAVVGGANNQLATAADAEGLARRGILYAPDFVVNAGGLIHVAEELDPRGFDAGRARAAAARIHDTTRDVLAEATRTGDVPDTVARRMARERIDAARADARAR